MNEKAKLDYIINRLAIDKAQMEVSLMELQFENGELRQKVAELTQPKEVGMNEESTV